MTIRSARLVAAVHGKSRVLLTTSEAVKFRCRIEEKSTAEDAKDAKENP
jgi:hypothetical protein